MTWRDLENEERYEMRIAWGLGGPLGVSPIVFIALPNPYEAEALEKLEWALEFIRRARKDAKASILRGNCVPALLIECSSFHVRRRRDGTLPPPPIVRWLASKLPFEIDLPRQRLTLHIVYYGSDKVQVLQETREKFT